MERRIEGVLSFPSLLRPTTTESILVQDQELLIPKVELTLRSWTGATILNTFGGKPLLDFGGRPVFAELCAYELARLSGWEARWVETYGAAAMRPNCFTAWADAPLGGQEHVPISDDGILSLLQRMAAANGNTYAGYWGAVAWQGNPVVFMELKRRKQDRLRASQLGWVGAGIKLRKPSVGAVRESMSAFPSDAKFTGLR